jgi:hypothetical protein
VEHAEVLGDVLLGCADRIGQVEDGRLARAEAVEQLDPRRLAQRAEALRDKGDQVVGKRVRDSHALLQVGVPDRRPERHV